MSLVLDGLTVRTRGHALFSPVSVTVRPGEIVTLMGPSGAGKSSLLAAICGTLGPGLRSDGQVLLGGVDLTGLPAERRRVGILFQDDLLFAHLSVAANLGFGLRPGAGRQARIDAALLEAELPGLGARDPATLSGGQRARVALMRTLLAEPRALLLDEPFGRLDAALRGRFRRFVFDHAAARRLPVLLVSHDPDDAAAAAGPVLTLQATPPAFSFDAGGRDASLASCENAVALAFPDVAEIDVFAASQLGGAVILDVRTAAEYAISRIPGSVRIEPDASIGQARAAAVPGAFVICSCSVGVRSARLARALIASGHDPAHVANLRGGIFRWSRAGLPLENDHGPTLAVHPFSRLWGRLLKN